MMHDNGVMGGAGSMLPLSVNCLSKLPPFSAPTRMQP